MFNINNLFLVLLIKNCFYLNFFTLKNLDFAIISFNSNIFLNNKKYLILKKQLNNKNYYNNFNLKSFFHIQFFKKYQFFNNKGILNRYQNFILLNDSYLKNKTYFLN